MIPFDFQDTAGKPGGSDLIDRILRRLRDTFTSLELAVTNARLINVTFPVATTDVAVHHGIGAPVRTWEVVDRDANAVVWQSSTLNNRIRDVLILQASAPVSVLIRVT